MTTNIRFVTEATLPTLPADDANLPPHLTSTAITTEHLPVNTAVIALDTDGVPYLGSVTSDAGAAVPIGVDTDGTFYVMTGA
jgi:hypothetical protein